MRCGGERGLRAVGAFAPFCSLLVIGVIVFCIVFILFCGRQRYAMAYLLVSKKNLYL